jgi:hypothetical protein
MLQVDRIEILARFSSEQLRDYGYCEETANSSTQDSVETSSLPDQHLSQSNDHFSSVVCIQIVDASSSSKF